MQVAKIVVLSIRKVWFDPPQLAEGSLIAILVMRNFTAFQFAPKLLLRRSSMHRHLAAAEPVAALAVHIYKAEGTRACSHYEKLTKAAKFEAWK